MPLGLGFTRNEIIKMKTNEIAFSASFSSSESDNVRWEIVVIYNMNKSE